MDQVPATQIIQLPFMSLLKLRKEKKKSAPRKKLTVHYLTAGAQDTQQLLFMFSILEYP